jgi:hypothetical protein
MLRALTICCFIVALIGCNKKRDPGPLTDGIETLIDGSVYVVHSMIYADDKPWTTSNIFVFNGLGDTIWIYGSGYGDFVDPCGDCNDNNFYLGDNMHGTGPATADVALVDSVITKIFGRNRDSVLLQFIVPHYHNDHINNEFIDAFHAAFHYPLRAEEKIWIHANDRYGATCNEPCCGTEPCPDKKHNKYFGVPYSPSWKPEYIALFTNMGSVYDSCNTPVKYIQTTSGKWVITKAMSTADGGHTDGTVNMKNYERKIIVAGTKSKIQCPYPADWRFVSVHGNIVGATKGNE